MDTYNSYLAALQKNKDPFIVQIEKYAELHSVPIMDSTAIETLLGLMSIQQPLRVLEIGSAIGYSAIRIADSLPNTFVTTIERINDRYTKAVEFIGASDFGERIQIIEADALEFDTDTLEDDSYDTLFIDAAKGQYKRFFEIYSSKVRCGGVIYCDNMFMHGMVLRDDIDLPRRNRTMIRNLKEFTRWVMTHPDYDSTLLPVGDGILIARKKKSNIGVS